MVDENRPEPFTYRDFFVSSYVRPNQDKSWFGTGCASIFLWFIFGGGYFLWEHFVYTPLPTHDNIWAMDDKDEIEKNLRWTERERAVRRLATILLSLAVLAACAAILYGLIELQNYLQRNVNITLPYVEMSVVWSIVVSLVLVLMNIAWNPVSLQITRLERHKTWSHFRIWHAFKLIIFKLVLATVLYLLVAIVLEEPSGSSAPACPMLDAGTKFLLILVFDVTLGNLVEVLGPGVRRGCFKLQCCRKCRGTGSDEDLKPDFNIAEEYLQVLYRQFILYVGTLVFPLIGILGFIANLIEYPIDKYRMLRVCREPRRVEQKMGRFLFAFMMMVGIVGMLTYPNGALWMLWAPTKLPTNFRDTPSGGVRCPMYNAIGRI